jgi:hypothetical protein
MDGLTIEGTVDFALPRRQKESAPVVAEALPKNLKVPRISRMMALAIRIDALIRKGVIVDYADAARLGHVSRARMTHIMNLLRLAPDIQEEILFLPLSDKRWDAVREGTLKAITTQIGWKAQRKMWKRLITRT